MPTFTVALQVSIRCELNAPDQSTAEKMAETLARDFGHSSMLVQLPLSPVALAPEIRDSEVIDVEPNQ